MKKPSQLRIIFILNALMMILPFVFYYVLTSTNRSIEGLEPIHMIYTGIGYIVSFAVLVFSILKKSMLGMRVIFAINILIALPTKAYLGILIAFISIGLSLTQKVKAYFST